MRLYSSTQAENVVGCTYRMIDNWVREGVMTPSFDVRGSGRTRGFSELDLVILRAIYVLRERGLSLQTCTEFVERIRKAPKSREIRVREDSVVVVLDLATVRADMQSNLQVLGVEPALV